MMTQLQLREVNRLLKEPGMPLRAGNRQPNPEPNYPNNWPWGGVVRMAGLAHSASSLLTEFTRLLTG